MERSLQCQKAFKALQIALQGTWKFIGRAKPQRSCCRNACEAAAPYQHAKATNTLANASIHNVLPNTTLKFLTFSACNALANATPTAATSALAYAPNVSINTANTANALTNANVHNVLPNTAPKLLTFSTHNALANATPTAATSVLAYASMHLLTQPTQSMHSQYCT
ncbi:hypothetical protein BDQ17DRAFT_1338309 [Cyathus striatus]|nr:hypothetical protein BDQ17DRAFT_1338309 [Cyathus striatus]